MPRIPTAFVVALTVVARTFVASGQPQMGAPPTATTRPASEDPSAGSPRYDLPTWVRERRPQPDRRSRELILAEMHNVGPIETFARAPRDMSPAERVLRHLRRVEDLEDVVAIHEGAVRELDGMRVPNRDHAVSLAQQRAALLGEVTLNRQFAVSLAQSAIDGAPDAPHADELHFRLAGLLAALGRAEEAQRAFDAITARYPASPFVPHIRLAAGDTAFARGAWAAAAAAYERASLPVSTDNRVRAYALYRLAWARALSGERAVALVHFDQVIAWATEHPEAPDVARLAEVAREERAALAARIAPVRTRAPRRRPVPLRAPGAPVDPVAPPTT